MPKCRGEICEKKRILAIGPCCVSVSKERDREISLAAVPPFPPLFFSFIVCASLTRGVCVQLSLPRTTPKHQKICLEADHQHEAVVYYPTTTHSPFPEGLLSPPLLLPLIHRPPFPPQKIRKNTQKINLRRTPSPTPSRYLLSSIPYFFFDQLYI